MKLLVVCSSGWLSLGCDDPLKPVYYCLQFRRIIIQYGLLNDLYYRIQFVMKLFEPKLIRLMNDDE